MVCVLPVGGGQNIIGNGQDHLVRVFNSQCILFDSI